MDTESNMKSQMKEIGKKLEIELGNPIGNSIIIGYHQDPDWNSIYLISNLGSIPIESIPALPPHNSEFSFPFLSIFWCVRRCVWASGWKERAPSIGINKRSNVIFVFCID